MPVRPLDTLLAIKVLSTVAGLNGSDVRVAATLIQHYNRKTGQCDPGLKRISRVLSISARTVIRSNVKLARAGLFRKVRHGGRGNRNSYEPNWSRFAELEASWRAKLKRDAQWRATSLSPIPGQSCHLDTDKLVPQTCLDNKLPQETYSKGLSKQQHIRAQFRTRPENNSGKRSAEAARNEAERRWTTAVHEQFGSFPITYGEIIEAIDGRIRQATTDAELASRGAGIQYLLHRLKISNGL